jgi:hypothetical protein
VNPNRSGAAAARKINADLKAESQRGINAESTASNLNAIVRNAAEYIRINMSAGKCRQNVINAWKV